MAPGAVTQSGWQGRTALTGLLAALCLAASPVVAQNSGGVMGAMTACQVERTDLASLPVTFRALGWRAVQAPLDTNQANRLTVSSFVNVQGIADLTAQSSADEWQAVWTEAIRWSNEVSLRYLAEQPAYTFLFEDPTGNLLFIQAGETDDSLTITCSMAVTAAAAAAPDFQPVLTPNTGPASIASVVERSENRLSTTTRVALELSFRAADMTAATGLQSDVVAVLFTSTSYAKVAP